MDDPAYVGIKDGTIREFCRDDPQFAKYTAKAVARWIKEGRTVERMEAADALARIKREYDNSKRQRA